MNMTTSIQFTVCDGMLLTRDLRELHQLEKCRIIDGSLTLTWMKNGHGYSMQNFTFPELVDIRGYLKIHQIDNIESISNLFPNLAVIRGQQLYESFALRITENKDLEDIGLNLLTHIGNGNVHIEKNSKLCFTETVNWQAIMPNSNASRNNIEVSYLQPV